MPTFLPGCHLVPRWRIRMLPGITGSPPNFFTPSRLPAVSRPLRELPPAFLCAMARSPACSGDRDVGDAHDRQQLAMTVAAAVVLAPALLENDDLLALGLLQHGAGDRSTGHHGRTHQRVLAADHQPLGKHDLGPDITVETLDLDHVVLGDTVLLAAGLDHCVHGL